MPLNRLRLPAETLASTGSEAHFGTILRKLDLATVIFDRDAGITFCNDYLLQLTGWSFEEVVGRNVFEVFLRYERSDSRAHLETLLASNNDKWLRENEIFTRLGERRLMRWTSLMLRSQSGAVVAMASVGEDITERRQAEARIAYLNRVYAVLSGINSLIVRVRDREELFREACRIATMQGAFPLAMMGIVDRKAMKIVTVGSRAKIRGSSRLSNRSCPSATVQLMPWWNKLCAQRRRQSPMIRKMIPASHSGPNTLNSAADRWLCCP